jgi:vitamin B12 transporter
MQNQLSLWRQCHFLVVFITAIVSNPTAYAVGVNLPEVIVIAPRIPLAEQISNPQLLDEENITVAHERSISDVLTGLPGLSLSRTGGFGQVGAVYVRGAGGQGLVTLDGIPLMQSVPGLMNLDTLPTEAIQSAEIERGPGAAYIPFQSLGGTVRLSTRDRRDTSGRLSVEGGSFGTLRETLQGGLAGKQSRMTVTLNRADAFDGGHLADSRTNPERETSHFTQGIMRFASDLTASLNWQGSMLYRNSGASTDKFGKDKTGRVALQDDANSHAHEETWLAQNSLNVKLSPDWDSKLQLGYTQAATNIKLGVNQNGIFTRLYLANWRNEHTLIDDDQQRTQWRIIWGGQGRYELGSSPITGVAQNRTSTTGFIDTLAQHGDLSAEAGVRIESFDQYGEHALFKTAAAWRITPEFTLRASGGTGYRLPSYTELLFLVFGNPNLTPERSASGDLGLEWYPVTGMKLTLNGYYQRFHDLITQSFEPDKGPSTLNVPDASIAGMELDVQYAWTVSLDTGISYSFSDNRNLNTDKRLPWRPSHIARVWGQQKISQLPITLWAEAIVRSSTWNDFANTSPIDGSVQINAAIRYAVANHAELYLRGENLTNNRTPQIYSTNMSGVAVYGGFKLDF